MSHQANLKDLARILMEKNRQIGVLKEQVEELTVTEKTVRAVPEDHEVNLFKQQILTQTDWAAFKIYFEKAHPGYLQRLRQAHSTLSDSEERLFLLIKLKLTTKEAAAMLGISADSVKKTRNRLRKRLEMSEDVELDGFIHAF